MSNGQQGIHNCDSSRCRMCFLKYLDTSPTYFSVCSDIKYEVTFSASCKTSSCIYLLSCKQCEMCYVGKTINSVRDRLNGHRGNIIAGTEAFLMTHHFTKVHNISDMQIKPIEIVDKKELAKREKFWMAELNTPFPYGLNDRVDFGGFHDIYEEVTKKQCSKPVYSVFNKVETKRRKRGRAVQDPDASIVFAPEEFINNLIEVSANIQHFTHYIRTFIMRLDNDKIKQLLLHVINLLNDNCNVSTRKIEYLLYVVKDMCLFKYQRFYTKRKSSQYVVIEFVNKFMDDININKIFNSSYIKSQFPGNNQTYMIPTVSYKYTSTTRSKILNYKKTIFDAETSTYHCKCAEYDQKFIDTHHKHIFTGDVSIVDNIELRRIFSYGPNYREQQRPDKEKVMEAITSGIDRYIDLVSVKMKTQKLSYSHWKRRILQVCKEKLSNLKVYPYNNILSKTEVKNSLSKLHDAFVIVPIDKASSNVSFICKYLYMEILSSEITLAKTFQLSNKSEQEIIIENNQLLQKNSINHVTANNRLPFLYWSAKMHKNPPASRFITSGKDTVTSKLSENVSCCLRVLLKYARNSYKYKFQSHPGINNFSIIDNRDKIIKFIRLANKSKSKKSLKTYDFSTLYTSIPHGKLKTKLSEFVKRIFSIHEKKFIIINGKWSYLSDKETPKYPSCSLGDLLEWIYYIIDNSYIKYQGRIYRQVVGIPMGNSCAPFLANLFLHVYEYDYISKLIEQGEIIVASRLSRAWFRYQDDFIIFNDQNAFDEHFIFIYPSEMILKSTNISPAKSTFLDLTISIYRNKFRFTSYDKRKDFGFDIVNYPNLSGNIPKSNSYGVFMSQLVRFASINDNNIKFLNDAKIMVKKLLGQGFQKHNLKLNFLEFANKYVECWCDYGVQIDTLDCMKSIF